jgi:hypothetical protein
MMDQIQLAVATVLLLAGSFIAVMNWLVLLHWVIYRQHCSWIPLAGGVLASIGLVMLPYESARSFCWIPLVLDWGCIPGLFCSAAVFVYFTLGGKRH